METGRKKKWSRIIAMMLAMVMIMQNVVSVGAAVDFSQRSGNFDENTGDPQEPDGNDGGGSESGELFSDDNFSDTNSTNPENDGTGDGTPEGDTSSGETDINGNEVPEVRQVINSVASQRVIQMTDSNNVTQTYIRYQVDVTNESEIPVVEFKTDEEMQAYEAAFIATTDVKILLPETLSYAEVSDEANTDELSTYNNTTEAAAVLGDISDSAQYAGPVYVWTGQSLDVNETKSFVAYALVEQGVTDVGALTAGIYANGQAVEASWVDAELLANDPTQDDSQDNIDNTTAVLAASANQSVVQYTNEDASVDTYIRYQVQVENTSLDMAAENAEVRLELPSTLTYAQYPEATDETAGIMADGQMISWTIEALEAQGQLEFVCYALVEKGVTDEAELTAVVSVNGEAVELGMLDGASVEMLAGNVVKADTSALDEVIEKNKEQQTNNPLLEKALRMRQLNAKNGITPNGQVDLTPYLTSAPGIPDGIMMSAGESLNNGWITLSMHFEEVDAPDGIQFPVYYDEEGNALAENGGYLYYDLSAITASTTAGMKFPNPLVIDKKQEGDIVNKNNTSEVWGNFVIDVDGKLYIYLKQNVGTLNNCKADLQFNAQFSLSDITTETVIDVHFAEGINKKIIIKPGLNMTASKTAGAYNAETGTFNFDIALDVDTDITVPITMKDEMGSYLKYLDESLVIKKQTGSDRDGNPEYGEEVEAGFTVTQTDPKEGNGFELVFNSLVKGSYLISYEAKLSDDSIEQINGSFYSEGLNNKAVFTVEGQTDKELVITGGAQYTHFWIQKTHAPMDAANKIKWTITVNEGADQVTAGKVVQDKLKTPKLNYYTKEDIQVVQRFKNAEGGWEREDYSLPWANHMTDDGDSWSYTLPSTPEKAEYIFTFYTTAEKPDSATDSYGNAASIGSSDVLDYVNVTVGDFGTGKVTKIADSGKIETDSSKNRYKKWITTIDIPADKKDVVYTDTLYGPHGFVYPLKLVNANGNGDNKFKEILVNGIDVKEIELSVTTEKEYAIDFGDFTGKTGTTVTLTYYSKIDGNGTISNLGQVNMDGKIQSSGAKEQISEYTVSKSGAFESSTGRITWTVNLGNGFGSQAVKIVDTFVNQIFCEGTARIVDDDGYEVELISEPVISGADKNILTLEAYLSDAKKTYKLIYQTTPIRSESGKELEYSNKVHVYKRSNNEELAYTDSIKVNVPSEVFDKSIFDEPDQGNGYVVEYRMVVNNAGVTYGTNQKDYYTIVDEMSSQLAFDRDSLAIYEGNAVDESKKLSADAGGYEADYNEKTHILTIKINNVKTDNNKGKTYLIAYSATVERTTTAGTENVLFENDATLHIDGEEVYSHTESKVEILASAGGSIGGQRKYLIVKKRKANGMDTLAGATFALYRKSVNGTHKFEGVDGTYEYLEDKVTNAKGELYFGEDANGKSDHPLYINDNLLLIETKAPSGYKLDSTPIVIKIGEESVPTQGIYGWGYEFNITNQELRKTVKKVWDDKGNRDNKRPESIWIQLYANGVAEGDAIKLTNDKLEYTWTSLDERDENGDVIVYTVKEGQKNAAGEFSAYTKEELAELGYTSSAFAEDDGTQLGTAFGTDGVATITNTHEDEKTKFKVTKKWEDNNNNSQNRPSQITIYLYQTINGVKGTEPFRTVTLPKEGTIIDNNTWEYEWTDLPKYAEGGVGVEIQYSAEEKNVPGYAGNVSDATAVSAVITNTLNLYTNINVTKVWQDNGNAEEIQPDSVIVELRRAIGSGGFGTVPNTEPLSLNAKNNWSGGWTKLPTQIAGQKVTYNIVELDVEGYESAKTGGFSGVNGNYAFTLTNTTEKVNLKGIKYWDDFSDKDGKRPTSIEFILKRDGVKIDSETKTLSGEGNTWECSWSNLPKYTKGTDGKPREIVYTVEEVITDEMTANRYTSVPAESADPTIFKFTNHRDSDTSKEVEKIWVDGENCEATRPPSIQVQLYRRIAGADEGSAEKVISISTSTGAVSGTQTLSEENDWKFKWSELPSKQGNDTLIYSVKEGDGSGLTFKSGAPKGYDEVYSGNEENADGTNKLKTTITNTHEYEKTSVRITKKWVDKWESYEDNDKVRPPYIQVVLLADGNEVKGKTARISKDSLVTESLPSGGTVDVPWSYVWRDLPKFKNVDGIKTAINYSVAEIPDQAEYQGSSVNIPGYEAPVIEQLASETYGFYYGITNTHIIKKTEITTTKTWSDGGDNDNIRPEKISVALYWKVGADGEEELYPREDAVKRLDATKALANNQDVWSESWDDLLVLLNKENITYTVKEGEMVGDEFVPFTAERLKALGYERTSKDGALDIVNHHETKDINIHLLKKWQDDSASGRPDKILVQLMADIYYKEGNKTVSEPIGEPVEVTGEGDIWVYTWENQPRMHDGKEIVYYVDEIGDLGGYEFELGSKAENKSDVVNVTNSKIEKRDIIVNKEWQDDNNRDGKRPVTIRYELYADGHIEDVQNVTSEENWIYIWEDLPVYRENTDGEEKIEYTVKETALKYYETPVVSAPTEDKDGNLIFTVTNTYKSEITSKTVTKEWQDDGDRDSLRDNAADTLYVQLYANGEVVKDKAPVKLADFIKGNGDEESKWTHTWDELPRYYRDEEESESEEIVYTVQEGFVDEVGVFAPCTEEQLAELGYSRITDTDDPMLIINKHDNELTEVRVKKKWEDNDNFDSLRRDIVIQLYSQIDGEQEKLVKEETLKLGTLTHTWDNLPVYENGQKITYSVKEIMPDEIVGEYVSEIAVKEPTEEDNVWKFTVTNTHDQITIDKSVKKNWSDNDDQDKIRPEYIEVQLMADGEAVNEDEKIRLSEQNEWYHEWTNLPKNKVVEGETVEIQYSVKELSVPEGYEETIIENESKTGFVINNKHQTDKTGYSVVKYWVDNNDPERPKEVKFQLYANKYNKKEDTWKKEAVNKPAAFTGTGNTWSYTWKNLDVMSGGKEIEYSVEEVNVAAGYVVTYDRHDTMTIATNTKTTTEFSKTDITGTQELAGATLQVWSGDGKTMIEEWKSTTTPHIIRGKLEAGKQYILKEALAPAGYAVADPVTFLVNSDGRIQTVVMKDAKTNISILKVDDNKKPLAGAELEIKDSKGTVIEQWTSTDKAHVIEGKLIVGEKYTLTEVKAPLTYFLAKDIAFTVPSNGIVELTMVDSQEEAVGKISATKKVTAMVDNELVEHKVASDATYYMALFKDAAGKERYTEYGIKEVVVKKDSSVSEAVTWEKLPSGTYYVFETNKNGTAIPLGERQNEKDADGNDYSYTCVVAGGTTNMVELAMQEQKVEGKINLENAYYELPSGYRYFGEIHINKKVLRNGSAYDTNTEFYAGIFTKDGNDYAAADLGDQASVVKLTNNGTVTVEVPLGGENQDGAEPITYYVMETDKYGDPLDTDVFAYEISGEGEVTLTQEVTEGTVTITNEVKDNTMELDVLKVDENDNPLAGAAFILTYREANVTAGKWTSTTAARTLTLIPGTYTLSELQAPTGYIKGSDATITIAEDGTVKVSGDDISYKNGIVRFVNKKSTTTTQSSGTTTKTSTTSGGSSTSGGGATNTVYKAGSVKTGDETPIALYLLILAGAVAIAGSVIFIKKRKSSK